MALKRTESEVLSQRYAKALFDFSSEKNTSETISNNLSDLAQLIAESKELSIALASPLVSKEGLNKALAEIASKQNYDGEVKNLFKVLVENRRAVLLPKIAEKFNALLDEKAGRIKVEVTSAIALDQGQLEQISQKIQTATSSKAVIKNIVDKSLIGGLTVKIGSKLFDDSIKGRLDRLKLHLNS